MNRAADSDWPSFSTGPRESIFALGVICVKFVELESVFQFVFETVLGLDPDRDMGKIVFARLGTGPALQLCEDCLPQMGRSDEVKDQISHFLSAMKICAANRNYLMHSHMAWRFGEEKTVLFKKSRTGNNSYLSIPLAQLKQVADEMNAYCTYGRVLGNAINNTLEEVPIFSGYGLPVSKGADRPLRVEIRAGSRSQLDPGRADLLSAPGVARRVPGGARGDLLPAARAATKAAAYLGDESCLGQGVNVHVGLAPAGFALGDDSADAVRPHVRQSHRRPDVFSHATASAPHTDQPGRAFPRLNISSFGNGPYCASIISRTKNSGLAEYAPRGAKITDDLRSLSAGAGKLPLTP